MIGKTTFTFKVNEAPVITSANNATATGFPTPKFSKTGTLPKGITFQASTSTFSCTPKTGSAGSYTITITAKNSSSTVTQTFTITVN
jgi:hypothetical protein